jgi:hypothetical protein
MKVKVFVKGDDTLFIQTDENFDILKRKISHLAAFVVQASPEIEVGVSRQKLGDLLAVLREHFENYEVYFYK